MSGASHQHNLDGFANNSPPILPPITTTPNQHSRPHPYQSPLPYDYRQSLPPPNRNAWPTYNHNHNHPPPPPPPASTSPIVPAKRRLSVGSFSDAITDGRDQPKPYATHITGAGPSPSTPAAAALSLPVHVCHICQKVYERADHLTRHLRSHENARSYACTRCPKRFNRADLLSRHEATHDRDGSRGRNSNRRTDRASEACANCASSKSKCDDKKPCSRCVVKELVCSVPPRRSDQRCDADSAPETPPMNTATPSRDYEPCTGATPTPTLSNAYMLPSVSMLVEAGTSSGQTSTFTTNTSRTHTSEAPETPTTLDHNRTGSPSPVHLADTPPETVKDLEQQADILFANDDLESELFQLNTSMLSMDDELSWGENVDHMRPPNQLMTGRVVSQLPTLDTRDTFNKELTQTERDDILTMVLDARTKSNRPKAFPSTAFLNDLLQSYIMTHKQNQDEWIHWASWIQACGSYVFLSAVIAQAAIATRADNIVRFGHALGNVTANLVLDKMSNTDPYSIDLVTAQTAIICIETGMWSGSHRAIALSDRLLATLVTKLRRSGKLSISSTFDDGCNMPRGQKSPSERNWKIFVRTESYRRLVVRLYMDDIQLSLAAGKPPFMSFGDMTFKIPAATQLWLATSFDQWQVSLAELRRGGKGLPCVADLMEGVGLVSRKHVDEHDDDLATKVILHGFYGLVAAYRETLKSYMPGPRAMPSVYSVPAKPASLLSQHEDLYRDFCAFSINLHDIPDDGTLRVFEEFLKLLMFVSVDHLQTLSNTAGTAQLARALRHIEREWESDSYSRYGLWHAAQVIRQSKQLARGSLCGLSATAVYYAALTLWAYSLVTGQVSIIGQWQLTGVDLSNPNGFVVLDGEETPEVRAFLDSTVGHPAVTLDSGPEEKRTHMLDTAIGLISDHHPSNEMSMPPLVAGFMKSLNRLKNGKF